MNQDQAPYFEAVRQYVVQNNLTFHVPGHQHGYGLPPEYVELLTNFGLRADITEVLGIDDIHAPNGQCGLAQSLAAQAYGSDQAYFLVNGSTVGNQAMLLSTVGPEDTVLIPQSSHRSVFSALLLSGAKAHIFPTQFDVGTLCCLPPTANDLASAMLACPQATAVFFTSPNYHGACADVERLVETARSNNLLVLVDEAWGSHLAFCDRLPRSAVQAGADLVCQSAHKMTAALTQGAILHRNGDRIDSTRLESVLRHLQTSSPSSLIVGSMDCARRQMAVRGQSLWSGALDLANSLRERLNSVDKIRCHKGEGPLWDHSRLLIDATGRGYTGKQLASFLRKQSAISAEMWEPHQALFLILPSHSEADCQSLYVALRDLPLKEPSVSRAELEQSYRALFAPDQGLEQAECSVRQAFYKGHKVVPLAQAVDQTSAELLYCYPPGIPLVCPGQRFSTNMIEHIRTQVDIGGSVSGGTDPSLETVLVLKNDDNRK